MTARESPVTDELTLLRAADPAPPTDPVLGDRPLDARALDELGMLLSGRTVDRRRRPRFALAAAGAAALAMLAVAVGLPLLGGGADPAYAATPPLLELQPPTSADPAESLRAIAAQAVTNPLASTGPAAADAPRREVAWQSWALSTRVAGEQVTSAVVPQETQLSWQDDGSAELMVTTGAAYFPTAEHERAYQEAGEPAVEGTVVREESLDDFSPSFTEPPPSDAAAMAEYLRVGHPVDELGTAELFVAAEDLHREWTLGTAQRAAVLEVLASAPGVVALGATTDRLGRPGEAFAVESDLSGLPTRYVLVIDPVTGALLASEQWLTEDAGKLDVPVPSVVAYTAWRD